MLNIEEAEKIIHEDTFRVAAERIHICETVDRVLAEDIRSNSDFPSFSNSAMDGYAVKAADTAAAKLTQPVLLDVVENIPAGYLSTSQLQSGQAMKIMTGAVVPEGCDAVIKVEMTEEAGSRVRLFAAVQSGENIRMQGEDVCKGDIVLRKGKQIRPQEIGLLASMNISKVMVGKRPRVAILATGDEVVNLGADLKPGQIRNSNSYALSAFVQKYGGVPIDVGIALDTREDTQKKISEAIALAPEVLIIAGGVSMGDYDFVKDVLNKAGLQIGFWKVAIKPGKPLLFGRLGDMTVFGLPGNPVSAMVTFERFVGPVLYRMQGKDNYMPVPITAYSQEEIHKKPGRRNFIRGIVSCSNGEYFVRTSGSQSSGSIVSMVNANGYIIVPEDTVFINKGEKVQVQLFNSGIETANKGETDSDDRPSPAAKCGPIVSIIGRSNSGKTTLVEKLIAKLKERGFNVGAIKHDVHGFEIDHEGKDSWKMTRAGADTVVIASGEQMGVIAQLDHEVSVECIAETMMPDADIIIAEGYKAGQRPKIEVTRTGELVSSLEKGLRGIVIEKENISKLPDDIREAVPCFGFEEIDNLTNLIERIVFP